MGRSRDPAKTRQFAMSLPIVPKFRAGNADWIAMTSELISRAVAMLATKSPSRDSNSLSRRRRSVAWRLALSVALVAMTGCLPRGPISLSWPWRHSGDCPDCDGDGVAVSAPHSMFHPVPTRPVFTPWLCDEPDVSPGTIASRRPGPESFDKRPEQPILPELADRRSDIRSASARSPSSNPDGSLRVSPQPVASAAEQYYNPAAEAAGSAAPKADDSAQ